jgi:hypothetical protein
VTEQAADEVLLLSVAFVGFCFAHPSILWATSDALCRAGAL